MIGGFSVRASADAVADYSCLHLNLRVVAVWSGCRKVPEGCVSDRVTLTSTDYGTYD